MRYLMDGSELNEPHVEVCAVQAEAHVVYCDWLSLRPAVSTATVDLSQSYCGMSVVHISHGYPQVDIIVSMVCWGNRMPYRLEILVRLKRLLHNSILVLVYRE